jgi:hypothetical protein
MLTPKAAKDKIVAKAKRLLGEVLGDQKLHDEGHAQEDQVEQDNPPSDIKPFGNLNQLT